MKTVFYPSFGRDTYSAFYEIAIRRDQQNTSTDIVVIHSPKLGLPLSLWNTDSGRDIVLNKILSTDLQGVPLSSVRFFVLIDNMKELGRMDGLEFDIHLDFDDYKQKGNPYFSPSLRQRLFRWPSRPVRYTFLTRDVVGGCARFFTRFNQSRHVPLNEMHELCAAVGYQYPRTGLPHWIAQLFSGNPPDPDLSLT